MPDIIEALKSYNHDSDYVLATIISTQGSTYRKPGAMMLINESLSYWGLLSGGCLEADIQQHCQSVFTKKADQVIHFDLRGENDLTWGLGLGCEGALTILLKYLPADKNQLDFFKILTRTAKGQDHILAIKQSDYAFSYLPVDKYQTHFNWLGEQQKIPETLDKNSSSTTLFIKMSSPTSLLICGGSPDVSPVTNIARQSGWVTTVIDHRKEYAQQASFPSANKVSLVKRSQWWDYELTGFDAVVIMSHQYERDKDYLSRLLLEKIPYIGLLGPVARRDKLLQACNTDYSQHEGRLFAPVGLNIGADTPETIALAIIAEIQAVKAHKIPYNNHSVKPH